MKLLGQIQGLFSPQKKQNKAQRHASQKSYAVTPPQQRRMVIPNKLLNGLFAKNTSVDNKSEIGVLTYQVHDSSTLKTPPVQTIVHLQSPSATVLFKGKCLNTSANTQNIDKLIDEREAFANFPTAIRFANTKHFEKALRHIQTKQKVSRYQAITQVVFNTLPKNTQEATLPEGAEVLTVKDMHKIIDIRDLNRRFNPANPQFVESTEITEKPQHSKEAFNTASFLLGDRGDTPASPLANARLMTDQEVEDASLDRGHR